MDSELLQRVMDLAEKTGDRVIVVNPESGVAHAILPFDAYEDLIDSGTASLRDLEDIGNFDDGLDEISEIEDFASKDIMPEKIDPQMPEPQPPATEEELKKMIEHDLEMIKMAEQSQKEGGGAGSLDVLDEEANEEQYYLEPLE